MSARTILAGGTIVDGTGAPPIAADLEITGEEITAILPREETGAPGRTDGARSTDHAGPEGDPITRIDCTGLVVCPGFIDIHTHSDLSRFAYPGVETRVLQGITTEVIGNCGMSPYPLTEDVSRLRAVISTIDVCPEVRIDWADTGAYLDRLEQLPAASNVASLVGHGSLRDAALAAGHDTTTASGRGAMIGMLRDAFDAGAVGLSFGLMYPPGESAGRAELEAMAAETAAAGGLLPVHMRSYAAAELPESIQEVLEITGRTGARLQISHLRAIRDRDARAMTAALRLLSDAPDGVAADAYPYLAGHTTALQMFPPELRAEGARAAIAATIEDPDPIAGYLRLRIGDPSRVILAKPPRPGLAGSSLSIAADAAGQDWTRFFLDLFVEADGNMDVIMFGSTMADTMMSLSHRRVLIASDGYGLGLDHSANFAHPRSVGTFPRAFRLLLDAGMEIERVVHKATGQPAARLGWTDRGTLTAGARADVVVLDPTALEDRADYATPLVAPAGIRDVLVNGQSVVAAGRATGARPGRLIRHRRTS